MGGKWDPLQDPPSWSLSWNDLKYTQGPSYWQFPSPPWKAWHIPVLGASSLHPSVYSSSLYRHLCLRLCLPAFWFLIFLGTFSSTLSLSSFSVFLVDFIFVSLALLSYQLPQSHKPRLFCSRQPPITGLKELKGGDQQRDGAGVGVARALLLQRGRGEEQKRAEKCPSQQTAKTAYTGSPSLNPFPAENRHLAPLFPVTLSARSSSSVPQWVTSHLEPLTTDNSLKDLPLHPK